MARTKQIRGSRFLSDSGIGAYGYPDPDPVLQSEVNALISLATNQSTQILTTEQQKAYNAYVSFRAFIQQAQAKLNQIITDPVLNQFRPDLITQARSVLTKVNNWR